MDMAFDELVGESKYSERLAVYREHFTDDQIHVLFLEDYMRDPDSELARCFEFLGVEPNQPLSPTKDRLIDASERVRDTPLMRALRGRPELLRLGRYLLTAGSKAPSSSSKTLRSAGFMGPRCARVCFGGRGR